MEGDERGKGCVMALGDGYPCFSVPGGGILMILCINNQHVSGRC